MAELISVASSNIAKFAIATLAKFNLSVSTGPNSPRQPNFQYISFGKWIITRATKNLVLATRSTSPKVL